MRPQIVSMTCEGEDTPCQLAETWQVNGTTYAYLIPIDEDEEEDGDEDVEGEYCVVRQEGKTTIYDRDAWEEMDEDERVRIIFRDPVTPDHVIAAMVTEEEDEREVTILRYITVRSKTYADVVPLDNDRIHGTDLLVDTAVLIENGDQYTLDLEAFDVLGETNQELIEDALNMVPCFEESEEQWQARLATQPAASKQQKLFSN